MSNRRLSASIAAERAFLLQAASPGGAAHVGFRPSYVNRMVVAGLIRPTGYVAEPVFSGSRGYTQRHIYEATEAGRQEAAKLKEKAGG